MKKIKNLEAEFLLSKICKKFDISVEKLKSKDRHAKLVYARQIYAFMSKSINNKTCAEIGNLIDRSHSNIVRARRKIKHEIKYYADVKIDVDDITYSLMQIDFIVYNVDLLSLCKRN